MITALADCNSIMYDEINTANRGKQVMKESQFDTQPPRFESRTTVSERDEGSANKICTEIENAASECETAETDKMYGPFETVADLMEVLNT